jgi:hypothetical protein
MTLTDLLQRLARLWAEAHAKELSTLGTLVAKDGKFFARLEAGKTCTIDTFERFLRFFREPGNWPAAVIPHEAADLLDDIEVIATEPNGAVGEAEDAAARVAEALADTVAASRLVA